MRFDGYGAFIPTATTSLQRVVGLLSESLQAVQVAGPTMRRWGQTTGLQVGGDLAAWVGFDHATGGIYIEGKGVNTPVWVSALRREIPDHGAPRIDVCEDYDEPGAFDRLQALVRFNKGPRVKGGYVALPDDVSDGRTWAAGVRGGTGYIRIYEPGKMKERQHLFSQNAARVELECRPHYGRDKQAAASLKPLEVWGLTGWTHKVGTALTECEIARFEAEPRAYSFDKTTRYIATTFRRHLEEMLANGEDLSRTFQAVWQETDERKKERH